MSEGQKPRRKDQRHEKILSELRIQPAVRASEIAQRLGVHVETIRRDLDELDKQGKINRTYGGALPATMGFEASLAERDQLLIEERRRIARCAASLISPGDVIMVDVGSTTAHFAQHLAAQDCDVQIITNSCKLLTEVGPAPRIKTILCPGAYSHRQGGVAGPETAAFLENYHADKVVLSVGGVAEGGLYEVEPDFAWVKRAMIANARTRILLADHEKLGHAVMTRVCGFDLIDHIVTDQEIKGPILDQLNLAGVKIHIG